MLAEKTVRWFFDLGADDVGGGVAVRKLKIDDGSLWLELDFPKGSVTWSDGSIKKTKKMERGLMFHRMA